MGFPALLPVTPSFGPSVGFPALLPVTPSFGPSVGFPALLPVTPSLGPQWGWGCYHPSLLGPFTLNIRHILQTLGDGDKGWRYLRVGWGRDLAKIWVGWATCVGYETQNFAGNLVPEGPQPGLGHPAWEHWKP